VDIVGFSTDAADLTLASTLTPTQTGRLSLACFLFLSGLALPDRAMIDVMSQHSFLGERLRYG
jgi:hypothetical protein